MDEREARLIADRVIAPDFRDIDAVLRRQPPRDVYASYRYIKMKRSPGSAEMRPLGHRLEVVYRFSRFDFHGAHQFSPANARGQHEIRKNLHLPDTDWHGLVLADIRGDVVPPLQLHLKETNHTIVLELLADGPDQNWAHLTSPRRQ